MQLAIDSQAVAKPRRRRSSPAFKLLVYLLYGQYPYMTRDGRGIVEIRSVYKFALKMGMLSDKANRCLRWLEEHGYIESLTYSSNRQSCRFRIRKPIYV